MSELDMTNHYFRGVASSADGAQVVAVTANSDLSGSMYISTNAGLTWSGSGALTNGWPSFWNKVACSADGRTLVAAGYHTGVFVSTNGAASWAWTNILTIISVACSADGARLAAVGWSGTIHTSADFGATWTSVTPTQLSADLWMAIASSADGCRLAAALNNGQIWVSQTTPRPSLCISSSGEYLAVSWLVPSMDFALQESSDLVTPDWTYVNITPTLNYTNIRYEVTIPAPAGNRYFRLISRP